jgi:adenylosuccinate synthase
LLNGYSALNVTKLDVLTGFDELQVCIGYEGLGENFQGFPGHVKDLEKVNPIYVTMAGWKEDIILARRIEDLPINAQRYLALIEKHVGVPVEFVGVGPGRLDMATAE